MIESTKENDADDDRAKTIVERSSFYYSGMAESSKAGIDASTRVVGSCQGNTKETIRGFEDVSEGLRTKREELCINNCLGPRMSKAR